MRPLTELLGQSSWRAAPELLGWVLRHTTPEGTVAVRLTEVEAYEGESDPASHAWRGRTPRNAVMYEGPGHLYVYRSYGLHWACNVVTGAPGHASAVLLRAGEVVEGPDLARRRRGPTVPGTSLARGPGNLAQALGLTGEDSGSSLLASATTSLRPPAGEQPVIASGHRVGVTRAHDTPWRFWLAGDPTVSAYRRSPRIV